MNILKGDKIMGDEVYEKKIKLLSHILTDDLE